jgi:hypothetical protein
MLLRPSREARDYTSQMVSGGDESERQQYMKKHLIAAVAALALITPWAAQADSTNASAKITIQSSYLNVIPTTATPTGWQTVLEQNLKMANNHDLLINAGFEVGLYTSTTVSSKNMITDTSTATANVKVQVLVDNVVAAPGEVVYGKRSQTLSATLEGAIAGCLTVVTNSAGGLQIVLDPTCVQPEIITLILDTVSANSFSFAVPNLSSGWHNIKVQAALDFEGSAQNGSFKATALLGKGTMTAESVRLANDSSQPYLLQ